MVFMFQDFGSGLTVDELVGLPAWHIKHIKLPPGEIFLKVRSAANEMVKGNLESFVLTEIWEDGHTVWNSLKEETPAVITPSGRLIRTTNKGD